MSRDPVACTTAPGRLEEQPFEQAVVERVQERAREPNERNVRGGGFRGEYPNAHAEEMMPMFSTLW